MTTNSVSAGTGSDVRTFLAAALLTFGTGVLVLDGYIMLDVFGGILGLVGAVFGIVWWRSKFDKVFPRDLPVKAVVILAVVDAVLTLLAFLLIA
ncbi:hypothetical protein HFP15_26920 [Amycolatopsis sp. K13G38]|uniref:Uncharacterized protein n=1 Tax=Amycolatopsis acididurans TaxID=2724524 RepID=A0ABX1JDR6_9PSEU|nr:hypothetical protein [Amycolatopsis acididurans]NKQ56515.1 hypothetical protein [Amycolatopsis acididurans]